MVTPPRPSQNDRVLAVLRDRGRDGVDQTMFYAPHTIDGGKPITRLAARINDLRRRGYAINSEIRPGHGPLAVYVLTGGPALPAPEAPSPQEVAEAARARYEQERQEQEAVIVVEAHVRRRPVHDAPSAPAAVSGPALTLFDQLTGVRPAAGAYDDTVEAA